MYKFFRWRVCNSFVWKIIFFFNVDCYNLIEICCTRIQNLNNFTFGESFCSDNMFNLQAINHRALLYIKKLKIFLTYSKPSIFWPHLFLFYFFFDWLICVKFINFQNLKLWQFVNVVNYWLMRKQETPGYISVMCR